MKSFLLLFFFFKQNPAFLVFYDLPGESPFWSKCMVSPDTPVKLVLIRNSSSLRPSMGRMSSHKPCFQMERETLSFETVGHRREEPTDASVSVPCSLDRGTPAWRAGHEPLSRWR